MPAQTGSTGTDTNASISPPTWWNPIGATAHGPISPKRDDELRIFTGKPGDKEKTTGILRVRREGRIFDRFIVHVTVRHIGVPPDEITRIFSGAELGTMFDTPNFDVRANDEGYAAEYDADFAVAGHFIRNGRYVCFPNPGTGQNGDAVFSFEIKDYMRLAIERMIRTGKIR